MGSEMCIRDSYSNEFVFGFLTQHDNDYLTELHQLFMQKVIRPQMRPKGFDAIKKHQDLGHTIVGITATSDFITAPIFREFGITEILATNAEVADGKYTGKVAGLACYQKGKLARLDAWLEGRNVSESWAYSDSINDRFLLEYGVEFYSNVDDRPDNIHRTCFFLYFLVCHS